MKKITLLAAFVTIVVTLVGPAAVLAADLAGSEAKSPEAIASSYVVDLVATAAHIPTRAVGPRACPLLSQSYGRVGRELSCLAFRGSAVLLVLTSTTWAGSLGSEAR